MSTFKHIYNLIIDGGYRNYITNYKSKSVAAAPTSNAVQPPHGTNLRLALGFRSRVGKDTAAEVIAEDHGAHIIRIAEPVYDAATQYIMWLKGGYYKDPNLLQITGEMMRSSRTPPVNVAERKIRKIELYGVFLRFNWSVFTPFMAITKYTYNKLTNRYIGGNIVVVDMRHTDEMEMLTHHEFETVKISRDNYNQVIDRNTKHISEIMLEKRQFHHHWENNGSLDDWKHTIRRHTADIIAAKSLPKVDYSDIDD
jgi:hypothetical protein